ncbi:MAG: DUF935 family protein [Opitutales bacterium]|nr:DUF935 family protein [Opitutales bacterium]
MNAKNISSLTGSCNLRNGFNPIRNLRPETLANALDSFSFGILAPAAKIFGAILERDDLISALALKRKKAVSRLDYEIVKKDFSEKAQQHAKILADFYGSLRAKSVVDANLSGSLRLLISQMMDAVAMKYSVHKIAYGCKNGIVCATFTQYPLWLFENKSGRLRLLKNPNDISQDGTPLNGNEWMTTCGDGLMTASSIAYIFKQLPLKDWLVYCERNGMPGIKAKTDAYPGSPQWEAACKAVSDFGAEFSAVLSQGTDIDAIDISTSGELPYKALIERIDKTLCSLWRGADLSTMSNKDSSGASLQWYESSLLEEDDVSNINETLNENVDKTVIRLALGDEEPLAKFKLKLPDYEMHKDELDIIERLVKLGLKPDTAKLAKMFSFPCKKDGDNGEV